ncbi:arsenate reductase (glutaredoxin) [Acinetobacter johnsonii]|uniref:arsenate reductase (glutaredoxin) n=1 Tax=Acinetobacter johnsonii TaxID=40214 RepID=UPI001918BFDE|nr:arsenate reductase (glutaredoxin) [Acinetobacter johnsonii]MDA1172724.1 arsenate reductase (glutaredoxin) [Pseudomonadota bacterium]MDH1277490.1 arsenate reductase (glutaredoxin) [Acinetobacter johnsonii]QQT56776.1 arsenate reductase (glutaredoxin) [Acinetobacter johnsonii]
MSATPKVKIYHNPECGTSRNTLALIRNANIEPEVIEYLVTPPSKNELIQMIVNAGLTVREAIRKNVVPYSELELERDDWTDEQLLDFMLQYPILINRPFVVTELGTCLSRPSELVLEILPLPQKGAFSKEDGEQVLDENGQRLK